MEHGDQVQGSEAFGAYLKKLREGRRLSLDAVEELSSGFPEKVTKSHLSRIENGLALPSFPRLMAMSHIYGIPIASMAERYEIELRREMADVDLGHQADADIIARARDLRLTGRYAEALSLLLALLDQRYDSVPSALSGELANRHAHLRLQVVNCLIHLGRYESAKTMCEQVLSAVGLDQSNRLIALQQFATCCYRLGRHTVALMALDRAEADIRSEGGSAQIRADLEFVRGMTHLVLGDAKKAAERFSLARQAYAEISNSLEACRAGITYAEALIYCDQPKEAQRILMDELAVAERQGYDRLKALAVSHLCLLAYRQGDLANAESYAIRSNTIARPLEFLPVVFRNSYYLWRIARTSGDEAAVRLNERSLRTYLGRLESQLPEADSFREFLARGGE